MIIVTGEVVAREGRLDALLAAGRAHSVRSRTEQGCISHDCYPDPERVGRIFFFERWTGRTALDAHFNTPGVAELMAAIDEHAAQRGEIEVYTVSEG